MLAYSLHSNIEVNTLMNDINKLISQHKDDSPDTTLILCICIKTVSHDDTSLIPKLPYKGNENVCII